MNFQKVKTLDSSDELLDIAIKRAKKKEKELSSSKKYKGLAKKVHIEREKVSIINTYITTKLDGYVQSFPSLDALSEFYNELIATLVEPDELKKSLSSLSWAAEKIGDLSSKFSRNLVPGMSEEKFLNNKRAYYGRVSSILERINKHLSYLENVRKKLKILPNINSNLFTVCIAGFPNVGKSTLLSKITPSKPDIQSYAFTTKGLNIGYIMHRNRQIQVIDTPGTLARFDKMNNIEKQAYLSVKYEANIVVFIYDLTDTYPLLEQNKLLNIINEFDKPVLIYFSKADLLEKEKIEKFAKDNKIIQYYFEPEDLINAIKSQSTQ